MILKQAPSAGGAGNPVSSELSIVKSVVPVGESRSMTVSVPVPSRSGSSSLAMKRMSFAFASTEYTSTSPAVPIAPERRPMGELAVTIGLACAVVSFGSDSGVGAGVVGGGGAAGAEVGVRGQRDRQWVNAEAGRGGAERGRLTVRRAGRGCKGDHRGRAVAQRHLLGGRLVNHELNAGLHIRCKPELLNREPVIADRQTREEVIARGPRLNP